MEEDKEASLSNKLTCPQGFSCTGGLDPNSQTLNDSDTVTYEVQVRNDSAPCNTYFDLENTATLEESDSQTPRTDSASVRLYTGACTNNGGGTNAGRTSASPMPHYHLLRITAR